ncbi:glycosyltransferase family 4 protein [Desulfoluna butyratoxydans]|uniref:Glycosyl transferase family 1 n=1 Tax=Desulfoluna butyratoxydans TaxID=231438 RepID=A0A4U8YVI6_9BACT|nr:glycosyltransferase family 4 protein [Desulfoluna butyratoxydans]VFQ47459.1 glycosyl transferase family 1 [Desulfoluna butyratoxydans]
MKILIINQHMADALGGSETQCDLIAKELYSRGHDVSYAAVDGSDNHRYSDFPYSIYPLNLKNNDLESFLRKHTPDIIYWRYNKNFLRKSVRVFGLMNIPFVFAISHINDTKRFSYKPVPIGSLKAIPKAVAKITLQMLRSAWNYSAIRKSNAVTSNNKSFLKKLTHDERFGIWNAVNLASTQFNWPRPYICWVANIKAEKRPEKFIWIAKQISKHVPNVDCLMVGPVRQDTYTSTIQRACKDHANFHYLGPKKPEEVNGILAESLCLVHTCAPEGFPNIFIQAWSQVIPTITLDFDPDGLIANEKLGFVSGNDDQMLEDILCILKEEEIRSAIGHRARNFARYNFSVDRLGDEVEKVFIDTINRYSSEHCGPE